MRRLSADSWIWIVLVLLVGVLVVSLIASPGTRRRALDVQPRRSTFVSDKDGYRALYLALEELDYRPRRLREPLTALKEPGVLILAEPEAETPVTATEWQAVLDWVAEGNLLILTTDSGGAVGLEGSDGMPSLSPHLDPTLVEAEASPRYPTPVRHGVSTLRARSAVRIDELAWSPPVRAGASDSGEPSVPLVPLYDDDRGPVLALGRHEEGTVIICASAWSFSNDGIGQADNFLALTHLIDVYGGGKEAAVWFDEYHHGYGARTTLIGLLPRTARVGLGQAVVALLLLLLAGARRFGSPRLLPELEQRSRTEYLASMAGLFQRVRAWDAVFLRLHALSLREMARDLGLPPGAGQADVVRAAAERRGLDPREVERILNRAAQAGADRSSRRWSAGEALLLAGQLTRLRQRCRRTE